MGPHWRFIHNRATAQPVAPHDCDVDPLVALVELGGGAHSDALFRMGVSWSDLRAAVGVGQVLRPSTGTYVLPQLDRARVAAAIVRGQLGCVSACQWWGVKSVAGPDAIHLVVPRDRHVKRARWGPLGVLGVHREVEHGGEGLIESLDLAVDHAARCTRPIEQLVIVESAMKQGKLDPNAAYEFRTGDAGRLAWLRRMASRSSHSVPESVARAVLDAAGLKPRPQDPHDGVGHIDLGIGSKHCVEIDGWDTHGNKVAFAEDRRRDRELAALKKWPLRYTYPDVMTDPRAFGLDVARVIGVQVSAKFDERMRWLMAVPAGHLNRRTGWRPPGT
jgi:hypothetical protein